MPVPACPQGRADCDGNVANGCEALILTGADTVEEAARSLAELTEIVVVTLAAEGAIACSDGELVTVAAERVERPVDTTGAGDLLTAAFVWADLRGADADERLRWAVLYATLAVTTPTGVGGAVTEAELLEAGTARGLVKNDFDPMFGLEFVGKLARTPFEGDRFLPLPFGHETLEHALRLADKIDSHPHLAQT